MDWNLTNETVTNHTEYLNRYLDAAWEKESGNSYRVTNNNDFLRAVKDIIGLTEEQFEEFVAADTEQWKTDRLKYHSHTSRLSDTTAVPQSG